VRRCCVGRYGAVRCALLGRRTCSLRGQLPSPTRPTEPKPVQSRVTDVLASLPPWLACVCCRWAAACLAEPTPGGPPDGARLPSARRRLAGPHARCSPALGTPLAHDGSTRLPKGQHCWGSCRREELACLLCGVEACPGLRDCSPLAQPQRCRGRRPATQPSLFALFTAWPPASTPACRKVLAWQLRGGWRLRPARFMQPQQAVLCLQC
jgi:hypothetical protein